MDDETIDLPLAPKKPYTPPQLHDLSGSMADGKFVPYPLEGNTGVGPS